MGSRNGPPPMKFGNPGERLRKKRWNLDELPKFEKNFYIEHPEVQHVSQVGLLSHTCAWEIPSPYLLIWPPSPKGAAVWKPRLPSSSRVWRLSSVLLLCAVWGGGVPQEEGDHHQRLRMSQTRHSFSSGPFSSSVLCTHSNEMLHPHSFLTLDLHVPAVNWTLFTPPPPPRISGVLEGISVPLTVRVFMY